MTGIVLLLSVSVVSVEATSIAWPIDCMVGPWQIGSISMTNGNGQSVWGQSADKCMDMHQFCAHPGSSGGFDVSVKWSKEVITQKKFGGRGCGALEKEEKYTIAEVACKGCHACLKSLTGGDNVNAECEGACCNNQAAPTLTLHGSCELENSAGAHISTAASGIDNGEGGLFDSNRIANMFTHSKSAMSCDKSVTTTVKMHTGYCLPSSGGNYVPKCAGRADGGLIAGNFLAKYDWNGNTGQRGSYTAGTQVFPEYEAGTYAIEYVTTDNLHSSFACIQIENVDQTRPIIEVIGCDEETLVKTSHGNYIDDGATCSDQVDGVISQNVEVSGHVVNLDVPNTYTIEYNCKDSAKNVAVTATRVVHVVASLNKVWIDIGRGQDNVAKCITLQRRVKCATNVGYKDSGKNNIHPDMSDTFSILTEAGDTPGCSSDYTQICAKRIDADNVNKGWGNSLRIECEECPGC